MAHSIESIQPPPQVPRANAPRLRSQRQLKRSHTTFTPLFVGLPRSTHGGIIVSESIVQGAAGACFLRAAVRLLFGPSGGKSCFERPSCAAPCEGSRSPLPQKSNQSLLSVSLRRLFVYPRWQVLRCIEMLCACNTRCGAVSAAAAAGGTQLHPNLHKFPNHAAASAAVFFRADRPASPLLVLSGMRCNSAAAQHVSGTVLLRMPLLSHFLPSGVLQRHTLWLSALRAQHPLNRCKQFTRLALENCKCMSPKAQTAGLKRAGCNA